MREAGLTTSARRRYSRCLTWNIRGPAPSSIVRESILMLFFRIVPLSVDESATTTTTTTPTTTATTTTPPTKTAAAAAAMSILAAVH